MSCASNWAQVAIDSMLPPGRLGLGSTVLEYATWGPAPADAPTIVLLHEGLGCVALWRDFPQRLSEMTGFGVFAFSRRGYGQSDAAQLPRPLNYMSLEACEVLPQVLQAIGSQRHILLGHSDGASIASIYAGRVHDEHLQAIVTMAPHFFTEDIALREIAHAKLAYENGTLKAGLSRYHKDPDNAFWGWNDSWLHPDYKAWDIRDVVDTIRVPVLAIQGEQDQYGTLDQIAVLQKRCQSSVDTFILDSCRHAPYIDQADQVLTRVSAFCHQHMASFTTPHHAYIPGHNQRHPEGWFDDICHTARAGMSVDELTESIAFQTGQHYLESGFYWEAHEVLEPVWMALPEPSAERQLVQALIQFANAQLKIQMHRPKAALRLCQMVRHHLTKIRSPVLMGVNIGTLRERVSTVQKSIK